MLERAGTDTGHVFNLGHGVLPETDPDVLTRLVELVHDEGRAGGRRDRTEEPARGLRGRGTPRTRP